MIVLSAALEISCRACQFLTDYSQWLQGNEMSSSYYPLRPELIESTYHQYRATGTVRDSYHAVRYVTSTSE